MIVTSDKFSYNNKTKQFTAEMSELISLARRSIDADVLIIESAKTGALVVFKLTEVEERAGDIQSWYFKVSTKSVEKYPSSKGCSVLIFND